MARMVAVKAQSIRRWVQICREKGGEPSANDVWQHIKRCWGHLTEDQQEQIFQLAEPIRRHR